MFECRKGAPEPQKRPLTSECPEPSHEKIQMDNDMIRIDSMVRTAVGVQIDVDRLARADGKKDQRKD